MKRKNIFLVLPAIILLGLVGCGPPEVEATSPANGESNVSVTRGQSVDFSTNTITVTFSKSAYISTYSSKATISPVPVAVSTASAHSGDLGMLTFSDDESLLYLYYSSDYKLTANTTHTIAVEGLWNSSSYMGQKSEQYSFSFVTQ